MKCIDYVGAEGDCIVIEQPTDIYPLLDWCQSRMMEKKESERGTKNKEKWENAIIFLSKLMHDTERNGFGEMDDVENVSYC